MSNVITARVEDDVLARLDRIAAEHDRSRAWVIQRLLAKASQDEVNFLEILREGEEDIKAGRVISHENLIAHLSKRWGGTPRADAA